MTVAACMKTNVISILGTAAIREAAALIAMKRIRSLPVVDENGKLLGVVTVRDLLDLGLPDFMHFIADVDFVHDFGAVEKYLPDSVVLDRSIKTIMKNTLAVKDDCRLLRAYALMLQQGMDDILVISGNDKLIGIASLEDVSASILSTWSIVK